MIIFSHTVSPRLTYVTGFLSHYFDHQFYLTQDKEEFEHSAEGKINYSAARITANELLVIPYGLLEKTGIEPEDISIGRCGGVSALFTNRSDTGFDIFAAIFFLLSRYEEYLPHKKDSYGRFAHTESIAHREGFLKQPLINIWLGDFAEKVRTFTHVFLPARKFSFTPTYDIDIAWSYQGKGWVRNIGGLFRSIGKLEFTAVKERVAVLAGKKTDPYDGYDWMDTTHEKFKLSPVYFFHVGETTNRYDKNISPLDPRLKELVTSVSAKYPVGLHPSWQSGDDPALLAREKQTLGNLAGQEIIRSRQHYIRFTLPETFRRLLDNGIREDYSMGYGSINGFRASIGSSFYWYDLEKEEATELLLKPFCYMDSNSFYEQKENPEQALAEMKMFHHILQHVGGEMITIFHNNFLGDDHRFKGWKEAYAGFLSAATG